MKKIIIGIFVLLISNFGFAQELNLSAQIRPRLELRNGYKTLGSKSVDGAAFISQRSRLNLAFQNKKEKVKFGMSLQNVRVWGDVSTLASSDVKGIALHQAWAEILINDKFSLKAGRQEIIYDDHRIFGSVGWAQQARSHDALIAKFKKGNHKFDLGLALNANGETLFKEDYDVNNYKTFQYVWYNTKVSDDISLSILILNNGREFENSKGEEEVAYSQTLGPRFSYSKNKFKGDIAFYYQTGKVAEIDLVAIYLGGNLMYRLTSEWSFKIGAEYLSGTDMNTTNNE